MNFIVRTISLCAMIMIGVQANAEVVYQVTAGSNPPGVFPSIKNDADNYELGDEVNLAIAESSAVIKSISFDYYAEVPVGQTRTGVLRIYAIDGADWDIGAKIIRTPGQPLFESQPFSLQNGGYTVNMPLPNLTVPKTIVWAVEFRGVKQINGDRAALYATDVSNPSVGSSYNDYWVNAEDTGWALFNVSPHVANFISKVSR